MSVRYKDSDSQRYLKNIFLSYRTRVNYIWKLENPIHSSFSCKRIHKAALPPFSIAAKQHSFFFAASKHPPLFSQQSSSLPSIPDCFLFCQQPSQAISYFPAYPISVFSASLFPFFPKPMSVFPQAHSIFSARLFPLFPKPISLLLSYCKPFPKPIPDHLAHPPFYTPFSHYKVKYFISHTQMFLNLFSSFIKLFLQVVIDNKSAHTFWGQLTSLRTERPAHALGEVLHWQ